MGLIAFFIITSAMEKKSTKNAKKMTKVQADLTKNILSTIQGIQVIKSYNLGGENNKQLQKSINDTTELLDRKSTRLNSSHANISYAVFCLKKKRYSNY